jgi:hypothetical protein
VITSEPALSFPTVPVTVAGNAEQCGAGRLAWITVARCAPVPGVTVPGTGPPPAAATEKERLTRIWWPDVNVAVAVAVYVPLPRPNFARHPPTGSMSAAREVPPIDTLTLAMPSGCAWVSWAARLAGLGATSHRAPVAPGHLVERTPGVAVRAVPDGEAAEVDARRVQRAERAISDRCVPSDSSITQFGPAGAEWNAVRAVETARS